MIKLNNKNITYVALADNNNSLKAPKEIWYADSNNSVKLVYRRKDALIEGEDYEKYHWLVGDADAYINTLKYYRPYDDSVQMTFRDNLYPNRESKKNKYNAEEQIWGTSKNGIYIRSYISGTTYFTIGNNILDSNTSEQGVNWYVYTIDGTINDSEQHSIYISSVNNNNKYSFIHNGSEKSNLSTRYTLPEIVQENVYVFYDKGVTNGYFNGSFFNFIHYRNNVEITHLTPCKLLKPVPKWLDANGIRRQIGECGMIDLVSGKFYGNVNSSGTFTVENYYERKEWLQGRNGAYIDTLYKIKAFDDKFEVHYHYDGNIKNPDNGVQDVFGYASEDNNAWIRHYITSSNYAASNYFKQAGEWYHSGIRTNDATIELWADISSFYYNVNGNNFTFSTNGLESGEYPNCYVFACNGLKQVYPNRYFHGNIAYFKITDTSSNTKMDLIPCTLTMDLPASMDANNIARTKGTSGMWDLVSDRFYGNVANSGTFKAVNLAEGVDYEVHQWLIRIGSAYISIPINLWQNRFDMCIQTTENYTYFNTYSETNPNGRCFMTYNWGGGNPYVLIAFREGGASHIYDLRFSQALSSNTISIFQKDGVATGIINGIEYQDTELVESSWNYDIECKVPLGKTQYFKVYNGDGTYRSNLIPVKLLRSIPAKYDANGIARQAGECGMYDTVNDKFYGNVASSGTFSVSDAN